MRLRTWEDGTPTRVYVLPDNHAVHVMFCKQILGVFPHQYRTAWDRLVYSGTGQAPLEVESEDEMRARVAGIQGRGGYRGGERGGNARKGGRDSRRDRLPIAEDD